MRQFVSPAKSWWLLAIIFCCIAPQFAFGQKSNDPPAKTDQTNATNDAWERLIYVPFRNLKQAMAGEGASAVVPLKKFLEVWDKLQKLESEAQPRKPIDAVLVKTIYKGKIEKDLARLTLEMTVRVLADNASIPLNFGEAALGKLTSDDEQTVLRAVGDGQYELVLKGIGEKSISLDIATRVRTSPDGRFFDLAVPPAVLTSVDFSVPGADQRIDLTPAAATTETSTEAGQTRIVASLGATKKLSARWRPQQGTAPVMEVLTSVRNLLDIRIADGLVHTDAQLQYSILRGTQDRLQLAVPKGARVLDVTATGLKSWQVVPSDVGQSISIELLSAEAKSIDVRVHTEANLPMEGFPIAGIGEAGVVFGVHAIGEGRENGVVVVSGSADLALAIEQQQGAVRIETAEIPEALRRPGALAWRYFNPKFDLKLIASPVEPRLQSERQTRLVFREEEVESTEAFGILVERTGVFELRFQIPSGFVVDKVECEQMKEHQIPDGKSELVVTLRERTTGRIALRITGRYPYEKEADARTELPLLIPQGMNRDRGMLFVFAPDSQEVIADEKTVDTVQPIAGGMSPPAGTRLSAGWSFQVRPQIVVRTERRQPRLTAAIATNVNVRQDVVEVDSLLNFSVQFAGIESFRFAVPEAVADSVQVSTADSTTPAIQQQARDGDAVDGWVPWKVVLQRGATGIVRFRVRYDLKPERKGPQKQSNFAISPVRILASPESPQRPEPTRPTSIEGQLVVKRERALSVGASAVEPFESIDVRELTLLPQEGDLAYRWFAQPSDLATPMSVDVASAQLEVQEVVETVVARAAMEAVVTEDSKVTCRVRYFLKSSERQRLAIDLPKDAIPIDSIVAGKRVELERREVASPDSQWDAYRLSVSRVTAADEPFVVALVYQAPYNPRPLPGRGGNLQIPIPKLGGSGGNVVVQELRAAVWMPREYAIVGKPDGFTPRYHSWISPIFGAVGYGSNTNDLEQWFKDSTGGLFAFQTSGRPYEYSRLGETSVLIVPYWRIEFYTWIISAAVFGAGILLSRTSWSNRFTVTLVLGFVLALVSLQNEELVIHVVGAARFGLAAVVAWWCIALLRRPNHSTRTQKSFDLKSAIRTLAIVTPPPDPVRVQTVPTESNTTSQK